MPGPVVSLEPRLSVAKGGKADRTREGRGNQNRGSPSAPGSAGVHRSFQLLHVDRLSCPSFPTGWAARWEGSPVPSAVRVHLKPPNRPPTHWAEFLGDVFHFPGTLLSRH